MEPDPTSIAWRALYAWLLLPGLGIPVSLVARRMGHPGFLQRLAAWCLIVPLVLGSAILGLKSFLALIVACAAVAAVELARLPSGAGFGRERWRPVVALAFAVTWPLWASWRGGIGSVVLVAALTLPILAALTFGQRLSRAWQTPGLALSLGAGLAAWVLLQQRPGGFRFVLFAFSVVAVNDILAFVGGRFVPRLHLLPRLSPSKTLSGYVSGLASGSGTGYLLWFAVPEFSAWQVAAVSLLLSVAGVAGDLAASAVKRQHGVKDFGNLLGPQGGMVDRLDSLLAAGGVFHLLLSGLGV